MVGPVPAIADARPQADGDVKLNFQNANLLEVIKVVLGDMLGISYTVDPSVQGTVSMQTTGALRRDDLIPTLELLLRMNNAALVTSQGLYRVVPLANAMAEVRAPQLGDSSLPLPNGFSVRVVPGLHSALDEKHYHDSRRYDRDTPLEAPLRIEQFIEGGALSFLVRLGGRTVLTMGSMNFIEREFQGLEPDILLAGVNGSRLGLYDYDRRLLTSTGFPAVVLPTHWDNFRLPYGFSQQENVERNLVPFMETAREVSPGSTVIAPVHLEPIVIR